jgi:hypothetical protein
VEDLEQESVEVKSQKSVSTSHEFGATYAKKYVEGLNKKIQFDDLKIQVIAENLLVTKVNDRAFASGDLDVVLQIDQETSLSCLFPNTARISTTQTIPAGSFLFIELTSMAGSDVTRQYKDNKLSKIEKKWNFFNSFFQSSMDEVPGATKENSYALFVFNGADYVDVSRSFPSTYFTGGVVHMTIDSSVNWASHLEMERAQRAEERAQRAEERAQQEIEELKENARLEKQRVQRAEERAQQEIEELKENARLEKQRVQRAEERAQQEIEELRQQLKAKVGPPIEEHM